MPSRKDLEARAGALNIIAANYPNDSKLEQAIIYAESHLAASTTATTIAASPSVKTMHGGANV